MKRIIALILSLVCIFALFSCGEEEAVFDITVISDMYAASAPTKVVITTVEQVGEYTTLNGKETYVTGRVDGKVTSKYESEKDVLREVTGSAEVKPYIETVKYSKVYHDGKISENGGKWTSGLNFAPSKGDIAIELDPQYLSNIVYNAEEGKLTFSVSADNTPFVFGEDVVIDSDVDVVITNDGAVITGIELSYVIAADEENGYPETTVSVKTVYTYDLEMITIDK